MTESEYQNNIPECCKIKTVQEHADILMLCFGVLHNLACTEYCKGCEFFGGDKDEN